jgi:hypothetical protein
MAEEDISKTAFQCPSFVCLFKWVVMTFGLKNTGATYQRAMNLIFHDLLGMIVEVYIDNVVAKSARFDSHLGDLQLLFERMRQYGLKMNPLNCAFGVSAGRFLGFVVLKKWDRDRPKKCGGDWQDTSPDMQERGTKPTQEGEVLVMVYIEPGW